MLGINGASCALCHHYYRKKDTCENCPLYKARDEECDERIEGEERSPFSAWQMHQDPTPMLSALRLAWITNRR
jgi:hypothetical protein